MLHIYICVTLMCYSKYNVCYTVYLQKKKQEIYLVLNLEISSCQMLMTKKFSCNALSKYQNTPKH